MGLHPTPPRCYGETQTQFIPSVISATEWFNNNAEVYDKKLSSPLAIAETRFFEFLSEEIEDHHTVFDGVEQDFFGLHPNSS